MVDYNRTSGIQYYLKDRLSTEVGMVDSLQKYTLLVSMFFFFLKCGSFHQDVEPLSPLLESGWSYNFGQKRKNKTKQNKKQKKDAMKSKWRPSKWEQAKDI